jgi:parallel beta-helix repeat protein
MKKKSAAIIFILFLLFSIFSCTKRGYGSILYVPSQYSTIQKAVDAANPGDTILVASGIYQENVVVNKPLRIVGEDANTTIVDAGGYDWSNITKCFSVLSRNIFLENLAIRNAFYGTYGASVENLTIQNCIFTSCFYGIILEQSRQAIVQNNLATNNTYGMFLWNSSNCLIKSNIVTDNYGGHPDLRMGAGIHMYESNDNVVGENYLTKNLAGVLLEQSHSNSIVKNKVIKNEDPIYGQGFGIQLFDSNENTITNNSIEQDSIGITSSSYNVIKYNVILKGGGIGGGAGYGNIFYKNTISGGLVGFSMEAANDFFVGNLIINCTYGFLIHYSNGSVFYHNVLINNTTHFPKDVYSDFNTFDNGFEGNYWSNYTGVDSDQDGIGDTPHVLDENNMDRFPLIAPISIFDAGIWNDAQQEIHIISNSTITNFELDKANAIISFEVAGKTGLGFCRVTIPNIIVEDLWNSNYTVLVNGEKPIMIKNWTRSNNTYLYFTYYHSQQTVIIIPEYSSNILIPFLILLPLLTIFVKKKR